MLCRNALLIRSEFSDSMKALRAEAIELRLLVRISDAEVFFSAGGLLVRTDGSVGVYPIAS